MPQIIVDRVDEYIQARLETGVDLRTAWYLAWVEYHAFMVDCEKTAVAVLHERYPDVLVRL